MFLAHGYAFLFVRLNQSVKRSYCCVLSSAACEMYNAWSGDVLSCFVRECGMRDEGRREKIQKLIFFIKSLQALLLPFKFTFFFQSESEAPYAKSQGGLTPVIHVSNECLGGKALTIDERNFRDRSRATASISSRGNRPALYAGCRAAAACRDDDDAR